MIAPDLNPQNYAGYESILSSLVTPKLNPLSPPYVASVEVNVSNLLCLWEGKELTIEVGSNDKGEGIEIFYQFGEFLDKRVRLTMLKEKANHESKFQAPAKKLNPSEKIGDDLKLGKAFTWIATQISRLRKRLMV